MAVEQVDVAFVLVTDVAGERVLLVRNRDTWSLPGGRREDGETLAEAAVRETKEETTVVVEAGAVVHVSERLGRAVHDVFVVFRATVQSGEPAAPLADDDVSEVAWVPIEEASALMPWYPDGVQALLASPGAGYSVAHEQ
ncbi:NUDIX domain-containing protein [Streptomyces luteireticuli]|uniref:NUDIX domain-containing protein n=1 Tax=Streptomyces luteireticuli TaxID=173858 RepID=UPI003558749A